MIKYTYLGEGNLISRCLTIIIDCPKTMEKSVRQIATAFFHKISLVFLANGNLSGLAVLAN